MTFPCTKPSPALSLSARTIHHIASMSSTSRTTVPLYVVDTFSDKPFHGSPCPVCVLPDDVTLDEGTMENIAIELNMAEVAFLRPLKEDGDLKTAPRVGLRWFKPGREVKLCGHGAFATAAVLFYCMGNKNRSVTCETRFSGPLVLNHEGDVIRVDFPLGETIRKTESEYESFTKSLGAVRSEIQDVALCPRLGYLLVRLRDGWSRDQFETWRCDMRQMELAVSASNIIVVIVTIAGDHHRGYTDKQGVAYDFVSRVFVPFAVREEDPVTGSAHTVLAHYWSQQLGKNNLYAHQCSYRGGEVVMEVEGSRVHMTAHATVVMEGIITV